jgi:P27 family predicted phage terminase small subunit
MYLSGGPIRLQKEREVKRKTPIPAPKQWDGEVQRLWDEITKGWTLSDEGRAVLRVACEARERMLEADKALKTDGLTFRTRMGGIRAHPAVRIRREAESSFLQAMRQLGLEG